MTTITRWGNSLALRIPRPLADQLAVSNGSEVDLEIRDGALVVKPKLPRRYQLDTLLAQITQENIHAPVDTGPPQGGEVW